MKLSIFAAALAFAWALTHQPAAAQRALSPQGQALAECLTRSPNAQDRLDLLRWVFIAMARHPSVTSYSTIADPERVTINRRAGALYSRLMLDDCPNETRAAVLAEGETALYAPFATLGDMAMTELMGHPDVNAATAEMGSYMDIGRLEQLLSR